MEPVPWGPAERTRHQKSLVALQNPLSLPKQMGLWEGGQCRAAPESSGSAWCCLISSPGRMARAVLCRKAGFERRGWEEGAAPNGAASPLAFPRVGLASSLADLPAFCRRARAQQPPGLSRRRSSCGAAPVCPDNGRVLGGFRCLTSYKMFVNRIYPVARR